MIRAAWSILTAQYMDTDDVVFGSMVTGRQAPIIGIDRMIAPLINAVPVRVKFDQEQTIDSLLYNIQKQSIEMTAYEQTELLTIRRINANTDRGSRFNTLLVVQPPPSQADSDMDGPYKQPREIVSPNKELDDFNPNAVMIMCQLTASNGLEVEISFDSTVVDTLQMERMAAQFDHVLRQVCTATTQTVGSIDTLSSRDKEELWTWNAKVPEPINECVHDLIDRTVAQYPNAPAISAWNGNLSYAELDLLSTNLASQLVARGAGPGTVIPLCFEKSMWHPVAALAIMKSGAACLSMDATQPRSRLESIVKQVNPSLILTSAKNHGLASQLSDADVVIVDRSQVSVRSDTPSLVDRACGSDIVYGM